MSPRNRALYVEERDHHVARVRARALIQHRRKLLDPEDIRFLYGIRALRLQGPSVKPDAGGYVDNPCGEYARRLR